MVSSTSLIRSQQGTALVITLLLTVVVMSLGIYTLSKIKPFAENIKGLEHSVQARYHAKTGEEVAKLIYYEDLQSSQEYLESSKFAGATNDSDKLKAFCRTQGSVLVNQKERIQTAIDACIAGSNSTNQTNEEYCRTEGYKTQLDTSGEENIAFHCTGDSVNDALPINDTTGGVDTSISSQTVSIPQPCQGNSDLQYSPDGDCQNWNKMEPGSPVRINLSNQADLQLGDGDYNFQIILRTPNFDGDFSTGDIAVPSSFLTEPTNITDEPMILWNFYNDNLSFFPSSEGSSITYGDIYTYLNGNNGEAIVSYNDKGFPETMTGDGTEILGGRVLSRPSADPSYGGITQENPACYTAIESGNQTNKNDDCRCDTNKSSSDTSNYVDECEQTLGDFYEQSLGSCSFTSCYLEFTYLGGLHVYKDSMLSEGQIPYIEYIILAGTDSGTDSGDAIEIQDTRPKIESIGESGGYSIRNEISIEEDVLIPTASSPIGR